MRKRVKEIMRSFGNEAYLEKLLRLNPSASHTHTHTNTRPATFVSDWLHASVWDGLYTLPRPLCANKEFIQRPATNLNLFVTNFVSTHVLGMPWLLRITRITSGRSAASPLHT